MLSKVEPVDYSRIKAKHRDVIVKYPLINAVVSNLQEGFVYADSAATAFLVSTKSGFTLGNAGPSADADQALFQFLQGNRDIPDYLHFYNPAKSFRNYIECNWQKYKIRPRAQFRGYETCLGKNYEHLLPVDYRIAMIQEVEFDRLEEAFGLDLGHRYWNNEQSFVDQALGACLLDENGDPAAICYSACIVDAIAEVDTLVLPQYRQRGFLRLVSEPFFNLAIRQKLTPHWDTFVSNVASYRNAEKFALRLIQQYDLLSVLLR